MCIETTPVYTIVNSIVKCCTIRGNEVIIRSDDTERDTITELTNSIYY